MNWFESGGGKRIDIVPFEVTWTSSSSSPVGGNIDLTSVSGYKNLSIDMMHFADVAASYDKEYALQNYPGNFKNFFSITYGDSVYETNYNAETGILNLRVNGVARLRPGSCSGNIIIIR